MFGLLRKAAIYVSVIFVFQRFSISLADDLETVVKRIYELTHDVNDKLLTHIEEQDEKAKILYDEEERKISALNEKLLTLEEQDNKTKILYNEEERKISALNDEVNELKSSQNRAALGNKEREIMINTTLATINGKLSQIESNQQTIESNVQRLQNQQTSQATLSTQMNSKLSKLSSDFVLFQRLNQNASETQTKINAKLSKEVEEIIKEKTKLTERVAEFTRDVENKELLVSASLSSFNNTVSSVHRAINNLQERQTITLQKIAALETITATTTTTPAPLQCSSDKYGCADGSRCISNTWKCDGDTDCPGGDDERNCPPRTTTTTTIRSTTVAPLKCSHNEYRCASGTKCIPINYKCDGDPSDCPGGDDERNCLLRTSCNESCRPGSYNDHNEEVTACCNFHGKLHGYCAKDDTAHCVDELYG